MEAIIIQVFAASFFKRYAKQFFIGFCLLFSYFILIQLAGVFLANTRDYWTLFLSMSIGTEPLFIGLFWIISILYFLFGMNHILKISKAEENTFLRFTFNCSDRKTRWKLLMIAFSIINSPILLYCIYSTTIAYIIRGNLFGIITFIFLLILIFIEVIYIDRTAFKPRKNSNPISLTLISISYSSIKLYNLLQNNLSLLIILKFFNLLALFVFAKLAGLDLGKLDLRSCAFLALMLATFSSILIYKDFLFEGNRMLFTLNFPYSRFSQYVRIIPYLMLLLVPEIIFLFYFYNFLFSIHTIIILIAFLLIIRSIIYGIGNNPMDIIKIISIYAFTALFFILYDLTIPFVVFSILISLVLFYKFYQFEKIKFKTNY